MKEKTFRRIMLSFMMAMLPFSVMATEYYVSEVTLSPGQQTKIYLPDMYVEAMTRYGSGYPNCG